MINEQIFNRTENGAIWGLIALFLTNQNAGITIDFKMNVINNKNSCNLFYLGLYFAKCCFVILYLLDMGKCYPNVRYTNFV